MRSNSRQAATISCPVARSVKRATAAPSSMLRRS